MHAMYIMDMAILCTVASCAVRLQIIVNPPFVAKTGRTSKEGHHSAAVMTIDQKADKELFFDKNAGLLDYVCCWYKKASLYTKGTDIVTAFVSTSSICQGQQVEPLWSSLLEDGVYIDFAYTNFKWETEAEKGAYVFVVIVGFSHVKKDAPILYNGDQKTVVRNISPYLIDGDSILVSSRNTPLCDVPPMGMGNQPIDGGNYLFKKEEMESFVLREPASKSYFYQWYGAEEFINSSPRYCLWLGNCPPEELIHMPLCLERVQNVRTLRLQSSRASTIKLAEKPTRFQTENMPHGNYIVIPEVSSGNRRYIPMGYMNDTVICGNTVRLMPNASLYHFGVLMSNIHMAWMRKIGGYFGPSYRYSVNIVYNNYPWPTPTPEQQARIEETAQMILDARANHPRCSLAELYGEKMYLFTDLVTAHQQNDRAVWEAYGKAWRIGSESECVAFLMKLYQALTAPESGR